MTVSDLILTKSLAVFILGVRAQARGSQGLLDGSPDFVLGLAGQAEWRSGDPALPRPSRSLMSPLPVVILPALASFPHTFLMRRSLPFPVFRSHSICLPAGLLFWRPDDSSLRVGLFSIASPPPSPPFFNEPAQTLGLVSHPHSATYELCGLREVPQPLCGSVCSQVKQR